MSDRAFILALLLVRIAIIGLGAYVITHGHLFSGLVICALSLSFSASDKDA